MRYALMIGLLAVTACDNVEDPEDGENEEEVITTVVLTLDDGSGATEYRWADPEDDGNPVIDDITLAAGTTYTGTVEFLNELEDPAEDITAEIEDEADEHQVLFTYGSELTVNTTDTDGNGLPIGLAFELTATADADLTITLRHLPEEDGTAVKVDGLQEDAQANGVDSLPGDTDVTATFPILTATM